MHGRAHKKDKTTPTKISPEKTESTVALPDSQEMANTTEVTIEVEVEVLMPSEETAQKSQKPSTPRKRTKITTQGKTPSKPDASDVLGILGLQAVGESPVRRSFRSNKGRNRKYDDSVVEKVGASDEVMDSESEYEQEEEEAESEREEEFKENVKRQKQRKSSPRKRRRKHTPVHRQRGYKKRHQEPPVSQCEKCGATISSFQGYVNHMRVHQFDLEAFVCDICDKPFSTREKLWEHEVLHETQSGVEPAEQNRPFRCTLCVHRVCAYKQRAMLYRHMRQRHPDKVDAVMEQERRVRRVTKALGVLREKHGAERPTHAPESSEVETLNESEAVTDQSAIVIDMSDLVVSAEGNVEIVTTNESREQGGSEEIEAEEDSVSFAQPQGPVGTRIKTNIVEGSPAARASKKVQFTTKRPRDEEIENDSEQNQDTEDWTNLECPSCGQIFPDKLTLCNHAFDCSTEVRDFVNRLEKKSAEQRLLYQKSPFLQRGGVKRFTCGTCDQKLATRKLLREHIKVSRKWCAILAPAYLFKTIRYGLKRNRVTRLLRLNR